eukprot:1890491-Amphidinium_carterae.1
MVTVDSAYYLGSLLFERLATHCVDELWVLAHVAQSSSRTRGTLKKPGNVERNGKTDQTLNECFPTFHPP